MLKSFKLFGIKIITATHEEISSYALKRLDDGLFTHIVSLNSIILFKSLFSKKYRQILKNADLVFIESFGVELTCRLLGIKTEKRVNGIDLLRELLYYANIYNKTIYLLGGKFDVLTKAERNIKFSYPQIRIVGRHHGYFDAAEDEKISIAIQKSAPDFIFVAMGAPKQDFWINSHRETCNLKVAMGVGGSFDIFAGTRKRAPETVQELNLEWLYRSLFPPKRIFNLIPLFFYGIFIIFYSLGFKLVNLIKGKKIEQPETIEQPNIVK
ncbi:MAG: WecB/TagA/CpsF family glycosyltransferase [Spirochaetes bacterium]|nr:WecB/TagA/CpsF family glycosyltransferase [Spirochaetota bacterium]NLJ04571.1 WecB/TagA/CpsF family glycosyltransferase [Exilispira sp.]MBP8991017.1 WecB/TagA/CpsF family glycosyltransferase [Spirochaetota bacterium]HOV45418.1 WecB/TagA/CpsF family glycosyltransferase [Exilispira sp.]HQJ40117.1 WecB/TagA/CpsF family glycosyltransferase [Exilispira sp.]